MSTGPFTRTNRNTPQRNPNKSQQPTEASFTPTQPSTVNQETNKGGYVYKPPTRIARSNINSIKQSPKIQERPQTKRQEPAKPPQIHKIEQSPVQKPVSFVRKPATQIIKETTIIKTVLKTQVNEVKEEIKPIAVKSVSRLPIVRTNEIITSALKTPNKQYRQETQQLQQTPKPVNSPYGRTKPTVQQKPQVKPPIAKNSLQQLTQDSTKTAQNQQIKKPSPFYSSYPKKIIRRQSEKQTDSENPTQSIEEPKPNTPKFSEQESTQKPQMFSSAYSYRSKNSNSQVSVQSSQSSTVLRNPYQSLIHAPVEKFAQTQMPASTIVDNPVKSPSKSPLSHAPRYSNRAEISVNEQQKVDENLEQQTFIPVKRSPMLAFALNRVYIQKMESNLQQFFQYSKKIKQSKENKKIQYQFFRSMTKFIKVYEQNTLTRSSFALIKSIFSKLLKFDMTKSSDSKVANQLSATKNQTFGKVLQNIIHSQLMQTRFSFIKLKSHLSEQKNLQLKREAGARILSGIEFNKMKQIFALFCNWIGTKYQTNFWKINRSSQINSNYKKLLLTQSWAKLISQKIAQSGSSTKACQAKALSSRPSQTKSAQQPVVEPQGSQENGQLRKKVSELKGKLSQAQQKNFQIPKESDLRKTIQQLRQQKNQISQEISTRKQKNFQLKERLESLISKASHKSLSSLSQSRKQQQQSTLSLLHEVYIKIYKQPELECTNKQNLTSLCTIHRVEQNGSKEIVAKWLAIRENMKLKHWINLYEGNYMEEAGDEGLLGQRRQASRQMQEENDLVMKFIRSYVKERYMWEEVKEYVAAVIRE